MKLFLAALLLTVFSFAAHAACDKEVVVGWEPYEPYQIRVGQEYTGIDFEIMQAVFKKMGCKVKFEEKPWKRVLAEMEGGAVGFTGSATKTPEREVFALFTDPYVTTKNILFMKKGDSAKLGSAKTLKDLMALKGFTVGVTLGYEYGADYAQLSKDPKFKAMLDEGKEEAQGVDKLAAGRISAMVMNQFTGAVLLKQKGLMDKIEATSFVVSTDDSYFMVSKKAHDEKFVKEFNAGLADLKKSGEHQKIIDRYTK